MGRRQWKLDAAHAKWQERRRQRQRKTFGTIFCVVLIFGWIVVSLNWFSDYVHLFVPSNIDGKKQIEEPKTDRPPLLPLEENMIHVVDSTTDTEAGHSKTRSWRSGRRTPADLVSIRERMGRRIPADPFSIRDKRMGRRTPADLASIRDERRKPSYRKTLSEKFGRISVDPDAIHNEKKPVPATICATLDSSNQKCILKPCNSARGFEKDQVNHNVYYGFVNRDMSILKKYPTMLIAGGAKAGSGCAISKKYRFIYIHVLKSGGMTLKSFLKRGLCNNSTQMPCQNGKEVLEIVDCARAVQSYPHYFIWSFVRNPFGRMYSAYAMALSMGPAGRSGRWTTKRKSSAKPDTDETTYDFLTFVLGGQNENALNGLQLNEKRNRFRKGLSSLSTAHYLPQTHFLFQKGDSCPVFDFLGRLENFNEDMKALLKFIGSPELQHYYEEQQQQVDDNKEDDNGNVLVDHSTSFGSRRKEKELGGNLAKAFRSGTDQSTTIIREAIAKEYERDFRLLGYDPSQIPP